MQKKMTENKKKSPIDRITKRLGVSLYKLAQDTGVQYQQLHNTRDHPDAPVVSLRLVRALRLLYKDDTVLLDDILGD